MGKPQKRTHGPSHPFNNWSPNRDVSREAKDSPAVRSEKERKVREFLAKRDGIHGTDHG